MTVAALDWRGQGGSQRMTGNPRRGHTHDFDDYQYDVEALVHEIAFPDCPPPFFALGQSMGGGGADPGCQEPLTAGSTAPSRSRR